MLCEAVHRKHQSIYMLQNVIAEDKCATAEEPVAQRRLEAIYSQWVTLIDLMQAGELIAVWLCETGWHV